MKRRDFLKKAGVGAVAASTVFGPVFAQTAPTIRWRLASSFPKSLDTIYGAAEVLTKRVSDLTDGKFQIRAFPAGEIVPAFQVLDAVQQGTVECGHTAMYYYVGKSLTMAFDTSLPFGLTARQQNAWLYYGGGVEAIRDFLSDFNVTNFPGGNTGAQMGGWWRKEVNTVADLKGIKFRIPGIGGQVWARLGMVPQAIPGGEIYQSLERGTIDGAEWVGPYDDEKLGLYKIAKYYYYPGWWEPGPNLSFLVNNDQWKKLPKDYQAAFETAAAEANVRMLANYDAVNPAALQRLLKAGVKLRKFSNEILKAAQKASFDIYEEESGKNPSFKKIYTPWKAFRDDQYRTMAVTELPYEQFAFAGI
ncbi:TRAP transporter substrate-binding protein [Meiothermus granaticius]|uniref:Extracytoplasmic solute receptor protein n=1 Tax=Meiothermus granaticius NBRC 107808 TaxID=1227551 RepID=A0A399F8J0_9DEIN|nr:TRAP transporter substrate-binding protein [Meiothermus granaticius]RIH92430.1 Monocarboxylate 2-oxoacid-binding periplasmic protein [Meiothermus granaticius NBRC 107808]GEM87465.1 ABC transporter substrate-binding protein [Meiothermus granaticius NBRC 107808]